MQNRPSHRGSGGGRGRGWRGGNWGGGRGRGGRHTASRSESEFQTSETGEFSVGEARTHRDLDAFLKGIDNRPYGRDILPVWYNYV